MQAYYDELIDIIKHIPHDKKEIAQLKVELCAKHGVKKIPKDLDVLLNAKKEDLPFLRKYLMTKPIRTMSGVSPVAIMTEPRWCPHGRCTYCPGGVKSPFGDTPQSYTGREPSTMRAIRNKFNPYYQVFNRLEYYVIGGHIPDKVDLIIQGGTFPSYDWEYQEMFVKKALQAMNDFGEMFFPDGDFDFEAFKVFFELPADVTDTSRAERMLEKMEQLWKERSLEEVQLQNERTYIRCIGMTLETRPDKRLPSQIDGMLTLGATRIELGVQSVYNEVLQKVHRDHTVEDSITAIKLLKNAGLKINAHMMPGLPLMDKEKDIKNLYTLFDNQSFRPDMVKIYPTLVMKGTPLFNDFKQGTFTPITTKDATEIIAQAKVHIPRYCRVMRVQRDIPTNMTDGGVDKTNLRQYIDEYMKKHKLVCNCIRCREIKNDQFEIANFNEMMYEASDSPEYFLSFDTEDDKLIGYCRMRFPSESTRKEIDKDTAIIRELHVNGAALSIGTQDTQKSQHKGFGKKLMEKAESLAKEHGKKKMVVISGIGVREYYKKLGYHREGPYMVKNI